MKTVNKNLILSLFKKMNEFKSTNVKSILETYFDKNVTVNITSPFKELTNIKEFNDTFWTPLFNSFPDLENQPYILVGGDYEKRSYVSCTGNFIGTFTKDWLDIPATKQPTWLRYAAHFMIEDNKILFRVGYAISQHDEWPTWNEGTEFKVVREGMQIK